ncbi:MAG: hypothetical protein ACOCZL_05210 [Bacteroidota bacterium]
MENTMRIQTIGGITKEEILFTLTTNVMPNTFVVENDEPYPGYHGKNLPGGTNPFSVFFMTRERHSTENVLRLNQKIKKYFDYPFDAVTGIICLNNENLPCIRVRGMDTYDYIGELQRCFFSEGVKFLKKRNIKQQAVITLKKIFDIEPIDNRIFKDHDEPSTFYIQIAKQLSFEQFRKLNINVRANVDKDKANFDAALAAIYAKDVIDAIRIFAKDIDMDKLKLILSAYEEELKKME